MEGLAPQRGHAEEIPPVAELHQAEELTHGLPARERPASWSRNVGNMAACFFFFFLWFFLFVFSGFWRPVATGQLGGWFRGFGGLKEPSLAWYHRASLSQIEWESKRSSFKNKVLNMLKQVVGPILLSSLKSSPVQWASAH